MRTEGYEVSHKRAERIWREEGLKIPRKQPKRGRLWLNDRSCIRLRPEHEDHVWAHDFLEDRTHDGRKLRMLTVVDEHTRECLAIVAGHHLDAKSVLDCPLDLFLTRGVPKYIRSDNAKNASIHP